MLADLCDITTAFGSFSLVLESLKNIDVIGIVLPDMDIVNRDGGIVQVAPLSRGEVVLTFNSPPITGKGRVRPNDTVTGMAIAREFAPHAWATARTAFGRPIRLAMSA